MFRVGLLVGGLATLSGCADTCANTVVSSIAAPDGAHKAVMFQRDCGATTGFSTQVSVVKSGEQPSGSGNVYRADDDHGAAAAGAWGGPWAEIEWLAPQHLRIRYARKSRVFEQKAEVSDVKMSYEQVTR